MRCIECEEIELARVSDQRPTQTMPVPYAALDRFPAGRSPSDLTRRRLLQWGVAGMASVYAAQELGWETIWESVAAASEEAADEKALVLLYLAGGNDGLNVLVPNETADWNAYSTARPVIHRRRGPTQDGRIGSTALPGPGGAALALANVVVSGAGNNGDPLYGLDTLYGDGIHDHAGSDLAVMPAVDAKQYNLSHFDNSDIWFKASNDLNVKTGWLGRWIDRNGNNTNPLQGISIDTALSKAIRTQNNPVCAIPSLPMPGFMHNSQNIGGANGLDLNAPVQGLAGVSAGAGNDYLGRSRSTYKLAVDTVNLTKNAGTPSGTRPTYPSGQLGTKLRTAATLLWANLGTRVITIHWGGFDTHTGQIASQDRQLIEFSRALAAFRADLVALGIEQRVSTLVFSEFGRRVRENGTGNEAGTDHGAGGLMFAMGSAVRGGFAADWPGCELSELTNPGNPNQGNLWVATDYRSVYYSVLAEWLDEQNPQSLLGGPNIDPLVRGDGYAGAKRLFK